MFFFNKFEDVICCLGILCERQGGGHNGSPPSIVAGGEWRGSFSGENIVTGELVVLVTSELIRRSEETKETVGQ